MGRKKKHPEHENLERWLVSYADFMTLLFATFTALYALAQTDASKLKEVTEAIREGFEEQSIMNGIKSVLSGKSPPSRNPDPISSQKGAGPGVIGKFDSMTYRPGEVKSMKKMAEQLSKDLEKLSETLKKDTAEDAALKKKGEHGKQAGSGEEDKEEAALQPVQVSYQERGIRISFDSRLLFKSGDAFLKPAGQQFLDKVAVRLKTAHNLRIHVEGHTDDQAIQSGSYPSNWELSSARAGSVVRYFIGAHQITPGSLVAVGYGSTQPLGNNQTEEGRSKNRRVDIVLYNQSVANLLNPRLQYLKERAVKTQTDMKDQKPEIHPVLPVHHSGGAQSGEIHKTLETPDANGPVKVIIKDRDGTEKIFIPKTTVVTSPATTAHKKTDTH
jgi:chemotaxis protein MotB